jgi:hypothetical protein
MVLGGIPLVCLPLFYRSLTCTSIEPPLQLNLPTDIQTLVSIKLSLLEIKKLSRTGGSRARVVAPRTDSASPYSGEGLESGWMT